MSWLKSIPVVGEVVTVGELAAKTVAAGVVAPFSSEKAGKIMKSAGDGFVEYAERNPLVATGTTVVLATHGLVTGEDHSKHIKGHWSKVGDSFQEMVGAQDYYKELPSSWDTEDVKKWKESARNVLKSYYLNFAGCQWHEFKGKSDRALIRAKVCYAMFGPPTEEAKTVEDSYSADQKKAADGIVDTIIQVYMDAPIKTIRIGFIFVACKQDESEFVIPVFSVCTDVDKNGNNDVRKFIDLQCRIYKDWEDWKKNNKLPMLKYAYPKRGFFTCSGSDAYQFDPEREPDVEFGTSPQCDLSSRIGRQGDSIAGFASLGAGVIGLAACFTPIGPLVLTGAAVAGGASAGYGATRGVNRLVDKGKHGESLRDMESTVLWISLAATPLHAVTAYTNGALAVGAQQGRIFSSNMRMFATVLNFTTLGVDSLMLTFGLGNLIQKVANDDLTGLDILQFSMSAFFFTNTLMQPKVAGAIIKQAQEQHINRVSNTMTDADAKASFKKFLDQNRGDGGISDQSKVIRTINRMEDANAFFKGVEPDAKMTIGGRKGRTVLVEDRQGNVNRINPNKVMMTNPHANSGNQPPQGPYNFNRDSRKLKKAYGNNRDLNDIELNGKKIFQNMDDGQKRRVGKVFGGSARWNEDVVKAAHSVAEKMNFNSVDDLMGVVEIVATEVKGKTGQDLLNSLNKISQGSGRQAFIDGISRDLVKANDIARDGGLTFEDPLTAVYHYRKHRTEFPSFIRRFGDRLEVYVGQIRDNVFQDANLKERCVLQNDGIVRKIYSGPGDKFGVITTSPDKVKVSTIFVKPGSNQEFVQQLQDFFANAPEKPGPVRDEADRLARFLGFRAFHVLVTINGKSLPFDKCPSMDPKVNEEIARLLQAVAV